jgi:anti-sigma factor RsiW
MTCDLVEDLIDLIAAGEVTADAEVRAHLSTCTSCARSLEAARRIDDLLRTRPVSSAPTQFTSRVMNGIRRASWRREQIVDWIFNGAMIAAAMLVAVGLWVAVRQSGLSLPGRDAMNIFSSGMIAAVQRVTPSLPLYAGATGLLVVALGLWWWASDSPVL